MSEDFMTALKEVIHRFETEDCDGFCSKCPLNNKFRGLEPDSVCTILARFEDNL
jgi:hypothetical protein